MTDRYVATTGANTGAGTSGAPWQTLAYAFGAATAGDRILLRGGTTPGTIVSMSGIAAMTKPLTVEVFDSEYVSLVGPGISNTSTTGRDLITVSNVAGQFTIRRGSGAQLKMGGTNGRNGGAWDRFGGCVRATGFTLGGLLVEDVDFDTGAGFAVYLNGSDNVTMRGGTVRKFDSGVQITGRGNLVTVEYVAFRELDTMVQDSGGPTPDPTRPGGDRGANGIVFTSTTGGTLVRYCSFVGLRAVSSLYTRDGGAFEPYQSNGVEIYGCWGYDCQNVMETGRGATNFPDCTNYLFHHNTFWRGAQVSSVAPTNATSDTDGMILRSLANSQIYHNTFADLSRFGFYIVEGGSFGGNVDNLKIKGNVVRQSLSGAKAYDISTANLSAQGLEVDYNHIYVLGGNYGAYLGTNYGSQSGFVAASGFGTHDTVGDPMFTGGLTTTPTAAFLNPGDFRLRSGSPCIDTAPSLKTAAKVINTPYRGTSPDRGAWEGSTRFWESFERTAQNAFGTPDYATAGGPQWTMPGVITDFRLTGTTAQMDVTTAGGARRAAFANLGLLQGAIQARFRVNKMPVGGNSTSSFYFRWQGTNAAGLDTDLYRMDVSLTPTGQLILSATKNVAGTTTALTGTGNVTTIHGLTLTANTYYLLVIQVDGTSPTNLRATVYDDARNSAPQITIPWDVFDYNGTDSDAALQASGGIGLRSSLNGASTAVPTTFEWDQIVVYDDFLVRPNQPLARGSLALQTHPVSVTLSGAALAADDFTRTVASGWGPPTSGNGGNSYVLGGTFANLSVNGSRGVMTLTPANSTLSTYLASVGVRDVDMRAIVQTDKLAVGDKHYVQLVVRYIDTSNYIRIPVAFATDQTMDLTAYEVIGGTSNALTGPGGAIVQVPRETHAANTDYNVRVQAEGASPTTVRAKVWRVGTTEPGSWDATWTSSSALFQTAGGVGFKAFLTALATNAPVTVSWDNMTTTAITTTPPVVVPLNRLSFRLTSRSLASAGPIGLTVPLGRVTFRLVQPDTVGGTGSINPVPTGSATSVALNRLTMALTPRALAVFGTTNAGPEELVYDSGNVYSTATQFDVPGHVLLDGVVYRWEVTVYDTDELSATLG